MTTPIISVAPLSFPWQTLDPFLFCAYHNDAYPAGDERMAPDPALLRGRHMGSDFSQKDGWSMYHGDTVPGFPRHPHRGFETISIARNGYIDHSDSMGAKARFGHGDVQWMTAGGGVVHSEMFPLVNADEPNPTELLQLWLNLPRASKMEPAHFTMFWNERIPQFQHRDEDGNATDVQVIAGALGGLTPLEPPPSSWASNPDSDVAVWLVTMEPGATWELPATSAEANRALYIYQGGGLGVAGRDVPVSSVVALRAEAPVSLLNGSAPASLLVLSGRPIGEPVAQHGPFVMNHPGEIRQAMIDYHQTQFGGWPWPSDGPVHPREETRFALYADGREDRPDIESS